MHTMQETFLNTIESFIPSTTKYMLELCTSIFCGHGED